MSLNFVETIFCGNLISRMNIGPKLILAGIKSRRWYEKFNFAGFKFHGCFKIGKVNFG